MAYTPPSYNAVNVNFTTTPYTPPAYNLVDFNFLNVVGTVVVNTRTYNLTLSTVNLLRTNYYLAANRSQVNLTFNPLSFIRNRVLAITPAILTLKLNLNTNKALVINSTPFSYTLNSVGLNKGPIILLDSYSKILTFNPINFNRTYILPVATTAYTSFEPGVTLNYGLTQVVDVTPFSLTNNPLAFSRAYNLAISTKSLSITNNNLILSKNAAGAIVKLGLTTTFNDVLLRRGRIFTISPTPYAYTTNSHGTRITRRLPMGSINLSIDIPIRVFKESILTIATKTYTLTNYLTGLYFNRTITPINYSYSLSNRTINLLRGSKIPFTTSTYTLTINPINLGRSIPFSISSRSYTLSYNPILFGSSKKIVINVLPISLTTHLNGILSNRKVGISTTPYSFSSPLTLKYARIFAINTTAYTLTVPLIYFIKGIEFSRDIRVLSISNNPYINDTSSTIKIIPTNSITTFSNSNENKLLII